MNNIYFIRLKLKKTCVGTKIYFWINLSELLF